MAKNKDNTPSTTTKPPAAPAGEQVRLRSRFPNYQVRGIHFVDHVAIVTPAQRDDLTGVREFGPGLDFWEEQPVAATPATGEPTPANAGT